MSLPTSQSNRVASDNGSDVARLAMMIRTALSGTRTAIPVKVIACTNSGGVAPIGTVDVRPLVSAIDGNGQVWDHETVYSAPYERMQGGDVAIILDPAPGDIGIAVACDRDISGVKSSGAAAAPGSNRRHDLSDMVYLKTIIAAAPTVYIQFDGQNINIVTPGNIAMQSASLTHNGVNVGSTHEHQVSGVQTGGSTVTSQGPQ